MVVKRIFDILDVEGHGAVTRAEFVDGLIHLACVRTAELDRLRFIFRCFDLDGSDAISRDELLVYLHLYTSQDADTQLSCPQLERVVETTFALVNLMDEKSHMGWKEFLRLVSLRPGLIERIVAMLGFNANKAMAQVIMDTPAETWMSVASSHSKAMRQAAVHEGYEFVAEMPQRERSVHANGHSGRQDDRRGQTQLTVIVP